MRPARPCATPAGRVPRLLLPRSPRPALRCLDVVVFLCMLATAGAAGIAHADIGAGAVLAAKGSGAALACQICHGAKGEGQREAGFPRLAGQPAGYLYKQLRDFADGRRENAQMQPIAGAMSEAQMRDVAAYYASLPGWQAPAGQSPATSGPGWRLATRGDWSKNMPACFACHGAAGAGIPPHFPALAGQPAAYLRAQIKAWQTGRRDNDPQGLMKSVADAMSDAEIDAVSVYLEHHSLAVEGGP